MKSIFRSLVLVIVFLNVAAAQSQSGDISGVWLATDVPYTPWTFDFRQTGGTLNGRVWQNGAVQAVGEIMDGKVNGDLVSFNISGPLDGGSIGVVTFTGSRNGDAIVFTRTTERSGGIGDGLYGTGPMAPKAVTIRRQPAGTVATPPGSVSQTQESTAATLPTAATAAVIGGQRYVAARGVAFAPWVFNVKIENGMVTGNATQGQFDAASGFSTTLVGPFEIYDGKANGDRISFKLRTPDGGRVVTFTGTRSGDQIAFMRSAEVLRGDPGRDGILGASGATQFTAILDSNPGAAVAQALRRPPGLPEGLQQYPGAPLDVPPEFEFLYQGGIPSGQLKATWAALPYESITLERSRCMGPCPAYKVTLHRGSPAGQGRETYEDRFGRAELHATVSGQVFPEKSGDFTGRVDIWSYGRLCYLLSKLRFSGLSDRYESGWSDQQTITVTVTASGNTKTVSEYGGVGPIEVWGIQEAIDSIAKSINWSAK